MRILFFSFVLSLTSLVGRAQSTQLFKSYLQDALATKVSSLELADKYFCTARLHRTDEDGEFARQLIDVWLSGQRNLLRQQEVRPDDVRFVRYDALTPAEQPAPPFRLTDNPTRTFVALYNDKIICYFWLQNDRIASTILLGMGQTHSFVDFCAAK